MRFTARIKQAFVRSTKPLSHRRGMIALTSAAAIAATTIAGHPHQSNPFRGLLTSATVTTVNFADDQSQSGQLSSTPSDVAGPAVGAVVPPTEGRIVAEFGRWFFVADYPEFAALIVKDNSRRSRPVNPFRGSTGTSLDDAQLAGSFGSFDRERIRAAEVPSNPLRGHEQSRFAFDQHADQQYSYAFPARMLIADNLMLDRVKTELATDQDTDTWTVSGEIISQFGRPCLLIHAANPAQELELAETQ